MKRPDRCPDARAPRPFLRYRRIARWCGAILLAAALPAQAWRWRAPPAVPDFADVTVHDPSLVRVDDDLYVFGSHLASARSRDGQLWTQLTTDSTADLGNALMPDSAVQVQEAIDFVGSQTFFAPDVIQLGDGRYYYYYCIGRLDAPIAALGLAVADDVNGPYVNQGVLLRSGQFGQPSEDGTPYDPTVHPNVIDPDVFFDVEGNLWMVYGSYSGGIFILELDPDTGLPLPGQGYGKKLTGGNHARIEGAYMLHSPESAYYYLFLSFGGLDANGGYNVRVGRSRNPDGPFHDAAGNDLIDAAGRPGTLFDDESIEPFGVKVLGSWQFLPEQGEPISSTVGHRSPGHNSAYYDPASRRHFLVFHTRFVGSGEFHQVRVHQLYLNDDDWLVAAPHRYAGPRPRRQRRSQVPGEYKVIHHGKAISPAVSTSQVVRLERNGRIRGAAVGHWQFRRDNILDLTLDGVPYSGVFSTEWDDDQGTWVYAFSALSKDGVAIWGSQVVDAQHRPFAVPLPGAHPRYGEPFELAVPQLPHGPRVYSYSVVAGPRGLRVDRSSGVVSWEPSLLDVGVPQRVTIRALNTDPDDHDEIRFTFMATAEADTRVRRIDLDFATASEGLLDAGGRATGLSARLPGTGAALPDLDPHLHLDTAAGLLRIDTTQADFNGGAGLANASAPGVGLASLGFTGLEDFAVRAVFRPLTNLEFTDQVGVYVGDSSSALTRAGTIVFGEPERYATHSENGADHSGRFFGFDFDASDGMTVTIARQTGVWRYFVDGIEWNPLTPPTFLEDLGTLTVGAFAITPLNAGAKTVELDSLSVAVATFDPTD